MIRIQKHFTTGNSPPQAENFDILRSDKTILQWEIARRRRKIFEIWKVKKVNSYFFFSEILNSYLFFSEILNSYLERLIPTYFLVKSLIPALKGGGN